MKSEFIYLDWNVIKSLIENTAEPAFLAAITQLRTKFIIPFSFAHLCDRQKGLSEKTAPLVKKDLDSLNLLSDGYMLGRWRDDFDISRQDIYKKYDEVRLAKMLQYPSFEIPEEILNHVKQSGFQNFFKSKQNAQWFVPIMFRALSRFDCDAELYKNYREIFKTNPPNELNYLSDLQSPSITPNKLEDIVDCFLKFNQLDEVGLCSKLRTAYLLLDLNPSYHEKRITNKNNFTNIYTDSEHLVNASFAKYYVTNDKIALKKTKFVFQAYNIKTHVFNSSDLVAFFQSEM